MDLLHHFIYAYTKKYSPVNRLTTADNNKHCLHEDTHWNSCQASHWSVLLPYWFFYLSYAYASSKNGIGKFGHGWFILKSLRWYQTVKRVCCHRQRPWENETFFPLQHTDPLRYFVFPASWMSCQASCVFSQIWVSKCTGVCVHCLHWLKLMN